MFNLPIGIFRERTTPRSSSYGANLYFQQPSETTKLQATLASSTSGVGEVNDYIGTHHPITCHEGPLDYHEDNILECKHSRTDPNDSRTNAAIIHSLCLMVFEIIHENDGIIKVEPWWN